MGTHQSNHWTGSSNKNQGRQKKDMQSSYYTPVPGPSLLSVIKKVFLAIQKVFVAVHYHGDRATAGKLAGFRMPWLKLGLAAVVVFIVTQKDISFSINMAAPSDEFKTAEMGTPTDQMGIAQPISWNDNKRANLVDPNELDPLAVKAYIQRFSKVATIEMGKFGIPASIKLAQAILESRAGQSPSAKKYNNHFGQPLSGQNYESAWANWRAHSLLLQEHFSSLFDHQLSYKKWAKDLDRKDYHPDNSYGKKLINIIEKYHLYLFDDEEL